MARAPKKSDPFAVPVDKLRWTLDESTLSFNTTDDLEALHAVIGQERGVEAFRFGMGMHAKGYNIFVTGHPATGRQATVKMLLEDLIEEDGIPDDLCYVNNFKAPERPILIRFEAGRGSTFKKDVQEFLDNLTRGLPQLFESEEYVSRKNEIMEAHEKQVREFYNAIEEKVKDTGLVVVKMQIGPFTRPDLVPLVDGEPKRMVDLEELVEKGRFPKEEYEKLREKRLKLKEEIDAIVQQVKDLHKEVQKKHEDVDKLMFKSLAEEYIAPLRSTYTSDEVQRHLDAVIEDMLDNLDKLRGIGQQQQSPMPFMMGPDPETLLAPYSVNLVVDNADLEKPPIIIESYPTYRNLFGSIERTGDRFGGWHTDFSRIKAGSFVKANGGYLVINLLDAIMEPGVWQTLKRSLKTESIEIETYDPFYFISASGLKPEPIPMQVKVVVIGDARIYQLLRYYDPDIPKIFKVRADYSSDMDNTGDAVLEYARFIKTECDKHGLKPFDASGVAAVVERAVRIAGRQEKLTTGFSLLADLLAEANHFAARDQSKSVTRAHVETALEQAIHRSNQIEERIQEMIDRGSIFVDTDGAEVGQVNGLAVYSMGDYMFGKPSRITAVTSMGKEGLINIEREADMSGPTHNKGMLILSGYLRRKFAQKFPLTLAASIAFEQSYGGVDGDSASSTELYALLSSLSGIPLKQYIAVTGSVNQKGEVQPIGGVNEKIEGFFLCCKHAGLTGHQGVMIPRSNVKDLMLSNEVIDAVNRGVFTIWSVATIDQGIEVLTGVAAGEIGKTGQYPAKSVNKLVTDKLRELAEGLRDFGSNGDKKKKSAKKTTKKK